MSILLGLIGLGLGVWYALYMRRQKRDAALAPDEKPEKPGRIYFLENQKNPGRIRIIKHRGELATPLTIVAEVRTEEPNAVLAQVYRDLEAVHISQGWYDGDAVRMYLDHLKGQA